MARAQHPLDERYAAWVQREAADSSDHIETARQVYQQRRDAMLRALADTVLSSTVSWSYPAGGFFLWVQLPETIRAVDLLAHAIAAGVAFVPGLNKRGVFRER